MNVTLIPAVFLMYGLLAQQDILPVDYLASSWEKQQQPNQTTKQTPHSGASNIFH